MGDDLLLILKWPALRSCRPFLQISHLNTVSSDKPLENRLLVYIHADFPRLYHRKQ
jgi:hypothetical protein